MPYENLAATGQNPEPWQFGGDPTTYLPALNASGLESAFRGLGYTGALTQENQYAWEDPVSGRTEQRWNTGMSDALSAWLASNGYQLGAYNAREGSGGIGHYGLFDSGGNILGRASAGYSNSGGWIEPVVLGTLAAIGGGAAYSALGGGAAAGAAEAGAAGGSAAGVGAGSPLAAGEAIGATGGLGANAGAIEAAAAANAGLPAGAAAGATEGMTFGQLAAGGGATGYTTAAADSQAANRALSLEANTGGVPSSIDLGSAGGSMSTGQTLGDLLSQVMNAFSSGRGSASGFGTARDLFNVGSGIYGISEARRLRRQMAPFDKYRGEYGERLRELERNPNLITSIPGYQAGLQAVQRAQAAGGYTGSGNEIAALAKYGGDFYNNELNRLAILAGAGAAPGAGSGLYADLLSRSLASIGYGGSGLMKRYGG